MHKPSESLSKVVESVKHNVNSGLVGDVRELSQAKDVGTLKGREKHRPSRSQEREMASKPMGGIIQHVESCKGDDAGFPDVTP